MEEEKKEGIRSEELLSRFRSKSDLYKYLTINGMTIVTHHCSIIVGLHLPSYSSVRLGFIRAILADKKKALKTSDIVRINIPHYQEISVKNIYEDARSDPDLALYLPDPD